MTTNGADLDAPREKQGEFPAEIVAPARASGWFGGKEGPRVALIGLGALLSVAFVMHLLWLLSKPSLGDALRQAADWVNLLASGGVVAAALVFGPSLAVLVAAVALLVHFGMPRVWQSARAPLQLGAVLGACLGAAWFVGSSKLANLVLKDWLFFVPVVPPALLAFQALISWRQRPRSIGFFRVGVSKELRAALEANEDICRFNEIHLQIVRVFGGVMPKPRAAGGNAVPTSEDEEQTRYGSHKPATVVMQFAVPGLLLLLVGFGALALAYADPRSNNPLGANPLVLRGLRWGLAGAFSYVLFTFGSRSFRNDLTVGAATWAVVTLITGPTLAVLLALAWKLESPSAELADWQGAAVLFFAGLAPRRVMDVIERVALQFLRSPGEASTSRLVPLTTLPGISAELALRLREENIEDVTSLAYADPIRLVQSMPYDLRQVVEWIDQAQLAVALPDQYQTLLQRGVTGAIDLAWRWLQACIDPKTGAVVIAHSETVPESFKVLTRAPDAEGRLLYDCARQMFYEEHVRLLWVMYNCFSTAGGDPLPSQDEPAPLVPPARPPATNGARTTPAPERATTP